jgi:hypothetical protein
MITLMVLGEIVYEHTRQDDKPEFWRLKVRK